jgi:hypothetical protein
MKRFLIFAVVGVFALGLASTTYASLCAFDAVPAATLLFPFVTYDYDGGTTGQTTLVAITNVSSEAQIVHITLWTDFSVAVLDFNLTLTGYDVQTMNMRDILSGGFLPTYDPDGDGGMVRDANIWAYGNGGPTRTPFADGPYSPNNDLAGNPALVGDLPFPESTWDNVDGTPPFGEDWYLRCNPDDLDTLAVEGWISSPINYVTPIDGVTLGVFQGYLNSSKFSVNNHTTCDWATNLDFATWFTDADYNADRPTWMYMTADVVGACNKELPDGNPTDYFSTSTLPGGVTFDNVLVGDVLYFDPADGPGGTNFSEADQAVHIEAGLGQFTPVLPGTTEPASFYLRYHDGIALTADWREPLPTAWSMRYMSDTVNQAASWIRAWKGTMINAINGDLYGPDTDNPADGIPDPISGPSPSELYANSCFPYTVYIWDENENVRSLDDPGATEPPWSGTPGNPITNEIPNLLPLETQEVDVTEFFLPANYGWMMFVWPGSNGYTGDFYQTWMGMKYQAFGNSSGGLTGQVLGNYNCFTSDVLPLLSFQTYRYSE